MQRTWCDRCGTEIPEPEPLDAGAWNVGPINIGGVVPFFQPFEIDTDQLTPGAALSVDVATHGWGSYPTPDLCRGCTLWLIVKSIEPQASEQWTFAGGGIVAIEDPAAKRTAQVDAALGLLKGTVPAQAS